MEASKAIHAPLIEGTSGKASTYTKAGNKTKTIFEGEIDAEEFNG